MTDVSALVADGRAAAEALMVDTCTITRGASPSGGFDAATGSYPSSEETTVYEGACKVQQASVSVSSQDVGADVAVITKTELHLPVEGSSGNVRPGDDVVLNSCQYDAALVGRPLKVMALPAKSIATARRFPIEETTT